MWLKCCLCEYHQHWQLSPVQLSDAAIITKLFTAVGSMQTTRVGKKSNPPKCLKENIYDKMTRVVVEQPFFLEASLQKMLAPFPSIKLQLVKKCLNVPPESNTRRFLSVSDNLIDHFDLLRSQIESASVSSLRIAAAVMGRLAGDLLWLPVWFLTDTKWCTLPYFNTEVLPAVTMEMIRLHCVAFWPARYGGTCTELLSLPSGIAASFSPQWPPHLCPTQRRS